MNNVPRKRTPAPLEQATHMLAFNEPIHNSLCFVQNSRYFGLFWMSDTSTNLIMFLLTLVWLEKYSWFSRIKSCLILLLLHEWKKIKTYDVPNKGLPLFRWFGSHKACTIRQTSRDMQWAAYILKSLFWFLSKSRINIMLNCITVPGQSYLQARASFSV